MGIQSSFNQLLATGAGAIALGTHIKEQQWANKNTALNLAESYNTQANEFNAENKKLLNEQISLKSKKQNIINKQQNLANAPEGTYTQKGKQMLETRYQNALNSLREQQLQNTKMMRDLSERRNILKEKRKLTEEKIKGAGLKDLDTKDVLGDNKDLVNKIKQYRKEGKL